MILKWGIKYEPGTRSPGKQIRGRELTSSAEGISMLENG